MRSIIHVLLFALLFPVILTAQKEKNIWYFGNYAGLDFNSGAPVVLSNGKLTSYEGCASVADRTTGKLLFYTNGDSVWNRNHQVMPNGRGLHGNTSSTQSALIVPMPGDTTQYYIFTTDAHESTNKYGISYSIVDMTRDQGRGDVVTSSPRQLITPVAEKLTAVRICDGNYWILSRGPYSIFYAFKVTNTGVSSPVVSQAGVSIGPLSSAVDIKYGDLGAMKASPNGKKIATANYDYGIAELFDFDVATGIVSNPVTISAQMPSPTPGNQRGAYGISFSPDNTKLYVSMYGNNTATKLLQFDVSRHDSISIAATRVELPSSSPTILPASLQLAPDGKIYAAMSGRATVSVIDYPNISGTGCSYREDAISLGSAFARLGLPNMIDADLGFTPLRYAGADTAICLGETAKISAVGGVSYLWSPGWAVPCQTCSTMTVAPDVTTSYTVLITTKEGCQVLDTLVVSVLPRPQLQGIEEVLICRGGSSPLLVTGANHFLWSPAEGLSCSDCPDPVASPTVTTNYTVIGSNNTGCSDTMQVTVTVQDSLLVDAGADVSICPGSSIQLNGKGGTSYEWTPAEGLSCTNCPKPIARPKTTTLYVLHSSSGAGCSGVDSVLVTVRDSLPVVDAGMADSICSGGSVQLHATGDGTFVWSPANSLNCTDCQSPVATPTATTTYRVTLTNTEGCTATDSVTITVHNLPMANAGADTTVCVGNNVQLQATGGSRYLWSPRNGLSCDDCASPMASPAATTTYRVAVTNDAGCTAYDSVTVTLLDAPSIDAGKDVVICAGESVQLHATGATNYQWSPETGLSCTDCASPVASPLTTTLYRVTTTGVSGCSGYDSVRVTVVGAGSVDAGVSQSICRGDSVQLQASDGATWQWSPSAGLSCTDCRNPKASPGATTLYTVTVGTSSGCSASDTVTVTVRDAPVISAGPNAVLCPGESIQLHAEGGSSYHWSPSIGLSCLDCADPIASPSATTIYHVSSLGANGCTGQDSVRVEIGATQVVHGLIGRTYTAFPGSSLRIPVILTDAITASGIDTMELDIRYGAGILLMKGINLTGGILEGWRSEPLSIAPGHYQVRIVAPTGRQVSGAGMLLTLEMQAFLGDSLGSELPVSVALVGNECQRIEITPGRVVLDSVCGLGYRLMAVGALKYALEQNDPNPFNPTTRIAFSLAFDGAARLEVFNARGERVDVPVDEVLPAGMYETVWDGSDAPSGLYYYRLTTEGWSATRHMVLVK